MNKGNTCTAIIDHITYGFVGYIFIITLLIGIFLSSYSTTAIVDPFSISVQGYCTFASSGNSYSRSVTTGATSLTIQGNNITTSCNDNNGYSIYAIGFSGDSYTATTHTDMIATQDSIHNIKTDGSSTYGSNWQMMLTANNDAAIDNSFNTYQNIPNNFTKVAHYNSNTDNSTITPTYQINISATQPSDTYTGKVKYVLVHPNSFTAGTYTISYHSNNGSDTTTSTTGLNNFEEQTLSPNTFTAPTNYYFASWCTTQDINQSPQTTCTGTSYPDEANIAPYTITANGTLNLYAIWSSTPTPANQSGTTSP